MLIGFGAAGGCSGDQARTELARREAVQTLERERRVLDEMQRDKARIEGAFQVHHVRALLMSGEETPTQALHMVPNLGALAVVVELSATFPVGVVRYASELTVLRSYWMTLGRRIRPSFVWPSTGVKQLWRSLRDRPQMWPWHRHGTAADLERKSLADFQAEAKKLIGRIDSQRDRVKKAEEYVRLLEGSGTE